MQVVWFGFASNCILEKEPYLVGIVKTVSPFPISSGTWSLPSDLAEIESVGSVRQEPLRSAA
jgi:hypothetical protein